MYGGVEGLGTRLILTSIISHCTQENLKTLSLISKVGFPSVFPVPCVHSCASTEYNTICILTNEVYMSSKYLGRLPFEISVCTSL